MPTINRTKKKESNAKAEESIVSLILAKAKIIIRYIDRKVLLIRNATVTIESKSRSL